MITDKLKGTSSKHELLLQQAVQCHLLYFVV